MTTPNGGFGDHAASDPLGHLTNVLPVQPAEGQRGDVRQPRPRRIEFGPEGDEHQHRELTDTFDGQIGQLARGRVDPLYIFEYLQDRLFAGKALELIEQPCQGLAALLHGAELERRIASSERDREEAR